MENSDVKRKNCKSNLILKFLTMLLAMYAFYKLPSILADKGFYYYNRFRGDMKQ